MYYTELSARPWVCTRAFVSVNIFHATRCWETENGLGFQALSSASQTRKVVTGALTLVSLPPTTTARLHSVTRSFVSPFLLSPNLPLALFFASIFFPLVPSSRICFLLHPLMHLTTISVTCQLPTVQTRLTNHYLLPTIASSQQTINTRDSSFRVYTPSRVLFDAFASPSFYLYRTRLIIGSWSNKSIFYEYNNSILINNVTEGSTYEYQSHPN